MTAFNEFKSLILETQKVLQTLQQDACIENFNSPQELLEWLEWRIAEVEKLDEEYKRLVSGYGMLEE